MAFADDETGTETSQPREFYEVTHGITTYRIASGDRDVFWNGFTFTASPSSRMAVRVSPVSASLEFVLVLPATHALAQRMVALGGICPQKVLVTARRMQLASGEVQQLHVGYVTSMAFDGHLAKFQVPGRVARALKRTLPNVLMDARCGNVLFDGWCTVSRAANTISATANVVDGRRVVLSSVSGKPDGWAQYGELVHVASGESMGVLAQVGNIVTIQYPLVELHAGDAVQLVAGCDHTIATCQTKFANKDNFSGSPNRPTRDLYLPTGLGVGEYT